MDLHAHAVAEAVGEIVSIPCFLDDPAGDAVHLRSGHTGAGGGNGRFLGGEDGLVDPALLIGNFTHSFGHGVGVEIHEAPNASPANDKPLSAGAVISAEPGIYIPGKLGVRIEDVIRLREEGCENLTKAPKELIVL